MHGHAEKTILVLNTNLTLTNYGRASNEQKPTKWVLQKWGHWPSLRENRAPASRKVKRESTVATTIPHNLPSCKHKITYMEPGRNDQKKHLQVMFLISPNKIPCKKIRRQCALATQHFLLYHVPERVSVSCTNLPR